MVKYSFITSHSSLEMFLASIKQFEILFGNWKLKPVRTHDILLTSHSLIVPKKNPSFPFKHMMSHFIQIYLVNGIHIDLLLIHPCIPNKTTSLGFCFLFIRKATRQFINSTRSSHAATSIPPSIAAYSLISGSILLVMKTKDSCFSIFQQVSHQPLLSLLEPPYSTVTACFMQFAACCDIQNQYSVVSASSKQVDPFKSD